MPSEVLEFFRETEPRFKEVSDDELTEFIAETKPEFLGDPQFKKRASLVAERRVPITALSREDEEGSIMEPMEPTVTVPKEWGSGNRIVNKATPASDVTEGQGVPIDIGPVRQQPWQSTTQGGPPIELPTPRVAMAALADQLRLPTAEPRISIPSPQPVEGENVFLSVGKEALNIAKGIPEFMTSEVGLASIPAAALAPVLVAGAFTADMLYSLGNQIAEVVPNWSKLTPTQKTVAVTDMVGTGLMAGMIGSHGYSKATGLRAPITRHLESQKARLSKDLAAKLGETEPAIVPTGPLPRSQAAVRAVEGKTELPPETKIVVPEIPPVRAEDFVEQVKPREGPVLEAEPERMEKVVGAEEFVEPSTPAKPPVEAKAKEPKPVTPKQQIKTDAKEFDDLLGSFGFSRDPTVETATGHGTESIKAKVKQSKDLLAARRKAFSELRAEGLDPQNPADRAAMLSKLKEYLAREEKLEPVPAQSLNVDAEFTIQGEKYTVKGVDPDTPSEPTIPKLRAGEGKKATGELFQKEDAPFNLAGEKATDFERVSREKEAAEKAKREAAELQAKQQTELPMEEPEIESRKPRQSVFDLKDEDLGRLFEERFPETEELGRAKYPFANYQEFKDWMAARYAERDLDGMKEAFAEVGAPFKVQYVKENRTGPDHLRDWISHMATGSPLPTVDPPKPRTSPRPMPGAWQAPPPGGTGKKPASGGPSAGATPPGATPPPPPPPKPPPPSSMPTAPVGAPAETVRASAIIKSMAEAMDRPIRIGHIQGGKSTLGIFKTKPEVARLRRANDIPTAAHEMAHGLERMHRRALGKGADIGRAAWDKALPADVRKEFKGLDYDPTQQRAYEGFAEFVRHWLTERDTQKIAPNAHTWFENVFLNHNPELKSAMGDIRGRAEQFQKQGSIKRVESMIRFEGEQAKLPLAERIQKFGSRILTLWSDDIRPLEQIEKEMNSGQLGMGAQSPSKIARVVTQASGTRARSWAKQGMTDFAGNRIGPSLKEIFGRDGVKGDERMAIVYAVSQRALELHKRGIDPGILKSDAQYVVDQLKNPAWDAFAKEIRQWNEGAMNYLLDAGGISKETFDRVSSLNQSYIPFYRIFEEEVPRGFASAGRRLADTPQPIKGIKGSGREIIDPIESMLNHANQIVSTADKIRVARSLVELSEKKAGLGKYVEKIPANKVPIQFDISRIARDLKAAGAELSAADLDAVMTLFQNSPRTPTGGNIVSFVRKGERVFYELHPELYRVVQALDHHQIHPLLNTILGIPSRAVRLGATGLRAGFSLFTNPVRDYASLLLQSRFNPVTASVKWIQHLGKQLGFRDSEIKDIWRTTGGELSQPLGMDRRSLQREIDEVMANTPARVAWHIVKHPLEFAREALSFTEAAPRLAEFEMTLRSMGWKPGQKVSPDMAVEAARNAAEVTIDFRRAGAWGRSVNQAVAFFNPSVQGLSKFNRAHISNTTRSLASGVGLITTAALTNWWINKDDPEWQRLPTWVKYGFLNFKIGGEWIRFPTPYEWWYAYGAVPMAGLNALYEKKPKEITEALGQAFRSLTPPVLPSIATPLIEAAQNRSFFTGRPIVSRAQAELLPQEQAKPYTSTTARKVSEILGVGGVDVSPAKIEHVLNGETGGLWSDLIGVSERLVGLAPPKESREPADIPIAGRLFVRDSSAAVVDEFYTELQHLSAKQRTYHKLIVEGSPRASKYALSPDQAAMLSRLTIGQKGMSSLRKQLNHAKTREERNAVFARMEELASSLIKH